jgi:HK97 family phage major capsid protein
MTAVDERSVPLFTKEQIGNMGLGEIQAQIKKLGDDAFTIEKKYAGPIESDEDEAQVRRILATVDVLSDWEAKLTAKAGRQRRYDDIRRDYSQPANRHRHSFGDPDFVQISPGDQFIRDEGYKNLYERGMFNSSLNRLEFQVTLKDGTSLVAWQKAVEQKALVYSASGTAGAFTINDVQSGFLNLLQREINVLDVIPRMQTSSDIVEYVREDTFTNNAAMVAEATATTGTTGSKPESVLAYSTQTAPVRVLAHWIPVTNKMLADAPAIRGIINSRLLLGLTLALETQILTGDGTGENFTGILNSGTNIQALGTDNQLDAIFKGRTLVRTTGHARPTAVILNPADWQDIRLARENAASATLGGYLMGPPSMSGASTVWGMPVVESEAETVGTGLVGDFDQGATLFDREQAAIRVGLINDQFTRNMQTILAELRAAFVVWRPTAFTRVTGI